MPPDHKGVGADSGQDQQDFGSFGEKRPEDREVEASDR